MSCGKTSWLLSRTSQEAEPRMASHGRHLRPLPVDTNPLFSALGSAVALTCCHSSNSVILCPIFLSLA